MQGRLPESLDAFGKINRRTAEDFANTMAVLMDCPVSLRMPRCNKLSCPSGRSVFSMDRTGRLSECPDVAQDVSDLIGIVAALNISGA